MREKKQYETANEWVMSLDNPTRAKYEAYRLWNEGIRAKDQVLLPLCYGYSDYETDILCDVLQEMEDLADHELLMFNPELGF